jgi:ribosome silencing factor RsfS/YbeB/iojap
MENIMHSQVDILEQDRSEESDMMNDVLKVHASESENPSTNSGNRVDKDWYVNAAHNIPSKWDDFIPRWKRTVEKLPKVEVFEKDLSLKLAAVVEEIKKENGANTVVLNMTSKCDYTDALIFTQGNNTRHVSAIAEAVRVLAKSKIETDSTLPKTIKTTSGAKGQDWVIVDMGKYIVHVFTPEAREYYDLEGLWAFVVDPSVFDQVRKDREAAFLLGNLASD